ncbi:Sodium:alanine symporter [Hyella patelloides LEGE 07179]|uniref:Sodium:alanine symporter n=1 Tax=Hyella patelloides LEGE 07179 TaxID=945734 RepID=A0A563VSD6_9CYAN|nr:alanine/glycine:cation symporter family protein [Hyella patelloides]VEP14209.1 Sodium:alanine symporter [Hyella patelloides LEGE 07179]
MKIINKIPNTIRQAKYIHLVNLLQSLTRKNWQFFLAIVIVSIAIPQIALAAEEKASGGFIGTLDSVFSGLVAVLDEILFFEIAGFPLIVLWLICGSIFFSLRMGFINIRGLKHAFDIVRGKYDDPDDDGEVSHFQALATALSGTVGLGNIAGVAIAVQTGGPGAVLWMTLGGFFGMSSKFTECTLAQKYRRVKPDGSVAGGPMYYISRPLSDMGMRPAGKALAGLFAILCIGASFGGGNMFQANQSYAAVSNVLPGIPSWIFGIVIAVIVGIVIIGGISRIASVTGKIVPLMAVVYVLACLWIILINFAEIPNAIATIFTGAFSPQAVGGGFLGVLIQGIRRSAFSNEAGVGSAAIAHSAARTNEPLREGIVALLEPLIDTIIICNMTALVIVITGTYQDSSIGDGVLLTSRSFDTVVDWFPSILAIAVALFAFSTMISWSYYGERAWEYLFGNSSILVYKAMFVFCVFLGAVVNLGAVLDFSDMMLLSMSIPNLIGCYLLSGTIASELKDYMQRLSSGEMLTYEDKVARGSSQPEEVISR